MMITTSERTRIGILVILCLAGCSAPLQQPYPYPLPTPTETSDSAPLTPYYGHPAPAVLLVDGQEQTSGVGTYFWHLEANAIVHADAFAVVAPTRPLTVTVPFTATLILPVPLPPLTLQAAFYPVTHADRWRYQKGFSTLLEYEHWDPSPRAAQQLPREFRQDLYFVDFPESLYIYDVRAEWAGLGSVNYGFLLYIVNAQEKWDPLAAPDRRLPYPGPGPTPLALPAPAYNPYPTP